MRIASAILLLFLVSACSSSEAGPHATVQLKDGTSVSGTVASTSASEIRITGEDNVTHAIPMSQVKSVDYGDAAEPATAGAPAKAGGAPTMAGARPRPASKPRPTSDDVTTETHVIDAGAKISVQVDETIDGS